VITLNRFSQNCKPSMSMSARSVPAAFLLSVPALMCGVGCAWCPGHRVETPRGRLVFTTLREMGADLTLRMNGNRGR